VDSSIQFWVLLNPCIISLALFVLVFTISSHHWQYPLSLLFALPLCWKWRIRGTWGSIALLSAFLAIDGSSFFWHLDRKGTAWDIGMFFSIAMIFTIMAIAFDEMKQFVITLQKAGTSHKHLNLKCFELESRLNGFEEKIRNKEEQIASLEKEKIAVKGFLKETSEQKSIIEKKLATLLGELESLKAKEENSLRLQKEQEINHLRKIEAIEAALEKMKIGLNKSESDLRSLESERQNAREELQVLNDRWKEREFCLQEQEKKSLEELQKQSIDLLNTQKQLQEKEKEIEQLRAQCISVGISVGTPLGITLDNTLQKNSDKEVERGTPNFELMTPEEALNLWRASRRSQGMYRQLREQFEEKSQELHKARKALFHAEEQIAALQKTREEEKDYDINQSEEHMQKYIIHLDQLLAQREKERDALEESLHQTISHLTQVLVNK
jgi:chromosome segregation ATPase